MSKLIFIELAVVGFKRLALSDTKSYIITPKNIQLILGTNGSGKSSLLDLMTPLPPNRKDFEESGYKRIKFMYNDILYMVYSQDGKHSMYKDDIAIIEHAGAKTMIDLCKEYFNITIGLHKFILGKTNMTNMSLQDRKEFITNISHIDYEYANRLYNNLKKKLRDEQAVQRHLNNKLLSLKEYILNEEEVKRLLDTKGRLNQLIYTMYEAKKDVTKITIDKQQYNRLVYRTKELLDKAVLDNTLTNINKLKDELAVTKAKIKELSLSRDIVSNKLFELSKLTSTNELELELEHIKSELDSINRTIVIPNNITEYNRIKYVIENDMNSNIVDTMNLLLSDVYDYIDTSKDELYTKYTTYINSKTEITNSISLLKSKINTINDKQSEYMKISTDIICTHCKTPIINDNLLKMLTKEKELLVVYSEELSLLTKELEVLDNNNPTNDYNIVMSIEKRINMLGFNIYTNNRSMLDVYNILSSINTQLMNIPKIESLEKRKLEIIAVSDTAMDSTIFEKTELEYENIKLSIAELSIKENKIQEQIKVADTIDKNIKEIEYYLSLEDKHRKYNINIEYNKSVDILIVELKSELNIVNLQLDKYNHSIREEETLVSDINNSNKDIQLLEIMISELSPSTGLIADSIKSFLINYINDVNEFINKVWSYRLDVMPYDANDLDKGITYRFPVQTVEDDNSDDIANTSESMKEIISLAFRVVSLRYMGMELYPLMIDEFGRSMDEVHLIKSYDLLEEMVEENDMQMFIIAHIKTAYARFNNAGMSIISNLNLEKI